MKQKTYYFGILLCFGVGINLFYSARLYSDTETVSRKEAIKIAKQEAIKLEYDVFTMRVEATEYDQPHNRCFITEKYAKIFFSKELKMLENKRYWVIYFKPIPPAPDPPQKMTYSTKGGDLCVFVDSNSGNVIGKLIGE